MAKAATAAAAAALSARSLGDLLQNLAGLPSGPSDLDALKVIVADLLQRRLFEQAESMSAYFH